MLRYEYLNNTDNGKVYAYYPEGKQESAGKVLIESEGVGHVLVESKNDFKKMYAFHAIRGIDIEKERGTVAWY